MSNQIFLGSDTSEFCFCREILHTFLAGALAIKSESIMFVPPQSKSERV